MFCNSFFGNYSLEHNSISFGSIGTSKKLCQKDKNKKYSYTSVRKLLIASLKEMELNPALTTRAFKYSYIKHLNQLGIPLIVILENLKIKEFSYL